MLRCGLIRLTSFRACGRHPTPANANGSDADVGVVWPPARKHAMQYLEIGEQLTVKKDLLSERMSFWDRVCRDVLGTPLYDFF